MYNGGERSAQITRRVICRHCGKNGKKRHLERCKSCTARCPNEVKMVQRQMAPGFVIQQQEEVPSTEKWKNEPKTLTATIEKGAPDQTQITFERASEQRQGFIPGDVIMILKTKRHNRYETTIQHLDEHVVDINTFGSIVRYGETRTFKGKGMPLHNTPSEYGNLHVEFIVDF